MVLQLVFARNEAAVLKYGKLEKDSDGLQAYQKYVVSYDAAVADICRAQNTKYWPDVRDCGIQFVSQQLFSHILAQSTSGLDYATFTKGMQRDAGSIYLALTYQELDSHRMLVASPKVRAVTVLGIAEGITRPFDGVRTQATFAVHLVSKWNGHISAGLVASLSIAQIHALRSPLRVWPEAKTFCHYCSRTFDEEHPRRACKGCRRTVYCDESCQRRDWKPFHKIVCKMWRLVAERESFRRVRAQIKQLPLDPVKHFPA
ncbi:hypothetical protein PENSPDRAFT_326662 [Peniophora sp. CONT]|nr:hypothetical protein PENSPDRAFT_326662 [Peniophora sp. CONT]